ncbi:MAG: Holliday junction resolvase RuvX [bacterium]|jgi:putative Holliday junction resolvase
MQYNPRVSYRFLALDIGSVRTGVAVSDSGGVLASPAGTIEASDFKEIAAELGRLLESLAKEGRIEGTRDFAAIIVGLPLGKSGEETERTTNIRIIGELLAADFGLPVHFVDERYSTRRMKAADRESGRREMKGRENIDARAAAEILQGWLDARRMRGVSSDYDDSPEGSKPIDAGGERY